MDTWLTPYIEEEPRKTPRHKTSVFTKADNKYNTLEPFTPEPYVHGYMSSEVSCFSESHKLPVNNGVCNT